MTGDTGHVTRDMWHKSHDMWHLKRDAWHVTHDVWWEVNIYLKCQVHISNGLGVKVFWRYHYILMLMIKSHIQESLNLLQCCSTKQMHRKKKKFFLFKLHFFCSFFCYNILCLHGDLKKLSIVLCLWRIEKYQTKNIYKKNHMVFLGGLMLN